MSQEIIAYFFSPLDRQLRHGDGRRIALKIKHSVDLPIVLCKNALHGSIRPLDALKYAPGPVLWKCRYSGEIVKEEDKLGGQYREYIAGGKDISKELREFARKQALKVVDNWECPKVVREWLESGDEKLRSAAESAAERAAWSAAGSAASIEQNNELQAIFDRICENN